MIYNTELEQSRVLDELDYWKSAIHTSEDSILNLKKELHENGNLSGGREKMAKHYQIIQDGKYKVGVLEKEWGDLETNYIRLRRLVTRIDTSADLAL